MKKVMLLATGWRSDYWASDKEAPYPKTTYEQLPGFEDVSKNCPLSGLGIYLKGKEKDFTSTPFVYLKITGMRYDTDTKEPYFAFERIKDSSTESKFLTDRLPAKNKYLFSVIDSKQLIKILNEIGEKPPQEWFNIIELVEIPVTWRDYVGKYFVDLKNGSFSNDEFEDRCAKLLIALGFDIVQKGHKIKGEFCDSIAAFESEYAVVYDCKNTIEFIPTAEDNRALEKYLNDEEKVRKEKYLFGAFIAKSFRGDQKDFFYFPIDSLLYLLYKKLTIGSKFNLSPFKKLLHNNISLTIETIDNEWLKS